MREGEGGSEKERGRMRKEERGRENNWKRQRERERRNVFLSGKLSFHHG